jgi:hypothetical protein
MRRRIFLSLSLILVTWGIFQLLRAAGQGAEPGDNISAALKSPASGRSDAPSPRGAATGEGSIKSEPPVSAFQASDSDFKPFEFARELTTFRELKSKVFLSDEEREVKKALLGHVLLMRALVRRLIEPAVSPDLLEEQEAGLDLLLTAYRDGDRTLAVEALREVVSDRQVEDTSLPKAVREQLAGVKAEVLYHWSALAPEFASEMARWLPGPVSEKIWANVAGRQQVNVAESEAERRDQSR